ncbi:cuticle protein 76-like [Rhopalosiphum maidis]|uniref:cuticle protein 76-like n=1 Tax=Rhopalosiphum maidis TaxID=43146 RepID=UPI000EFDE15C|nr:cuticle protein 76-like [Rhopalosiphum maidis]
MQNFKVLNVQCFGVVAALMILSVAADEPVVEPSLYSAAYLPPKPVVVVGGPVHYNSPYDGAVASTSTSVFRTPGHPGGQVSAVHKTVDTPYSSAHKSDVRYTNDVQLPYHHHPAAVPYGYGPAAIPYGYGPAAVPYGHGPVAVPYGHGPVAVPYGYGPTAAVPYSYGHAAAVPYGSHRGPVAAPYGHGATVVTPHSVSHASFSGPYGTHYSYRR